LRPLTSRASLIDISKVQSNSSDRENLEVDDWWVKSWKCRHNREL